MKKEIETLIRDLFRDRKLLINIGFSKVESDVLYHLIHGNSLTKISKQLNLPYQKVSHIKNSRLFLIPIFLRRKLNHLTKLDLSQINVKLLEMDQLISSYLDFFGKLQVYEVKELNLSKRTINILTAANIRNTNDLGSYSRAELLRIKKLGQKSVTEIELELTRLNLGLRCP